MECLGTQTPTTARVDNYTVMLEAYLCDRSTNTPNHLPATVYTTFTQPQAVDTLTRYSTILRFSILIVYISITVTMVVLSNLYIIQI